MTPGLIESKLVRPRLRDGLVDRTRIRARFERAGAVPVILVSAPAGYGKTIAVETWLASGDRAVAWVSADAGDNDPVRLWTYLATAVSRACGGVGTIALEQLRGPSPATEPAIDELAARLRADGRRVALVLEDVHEIADERCIRSLGHAARAFPPNVQLVLIARADPPLRLARMRSQGALAEIRAAELAFTVDEAKRLLVGAEGLALTDAQVRALTEHTEGWAAALYLVALCLRHAGDPARALERFDGVHRHVAEYLAAEVLEGLDGETRAFLLDTSVLPRFSPQLCDRVRGTDGSAAVIDRLRRSNLFVSELDDAGWFRYHALFRQLLLAEAQEPAVLHLRAAAWFRERGLTEEAAEHAFAAGDRAQVAELLEDDHMGLIRGGRSATLVRWLDALGEEVLHTRPGLLVAGAIAAGGICRPGVEIRRLLAAAEHARDAHPEAWLPRYATAVEVIHALYTDKDVGAQVRAAQAAAAHAREHAPDLLVVALGVLAHARLLAGDLDGAEQAAAQANEDPAAPRRPMGHVSVLATLAIVSVERGRPADARVYADQALRAARAGGITDSPSGARAQIADAVTAAAEGRLADAERAAARALRVREALDGGVLQAWMLLSLASIRVRRGHLSGAAESLARARSMLAASVDPGAVGSFADTVAAALDDARSGALTRPPAEPLSEAELAVLRQLPRSSREIAGALFLSVNTVKSHLRAIYRKLAVNTREDAVARASALGLLDSPG